jgi:hypothetical protein
VFIEKYIKVYNTEVVSFDSSNKQTLLHILDVVRMGVGLVKYRELELTLNLRSKKELLFFAYFKIIHPD